MKRIIQDSILYVARVIMNLIYFFLKLFPIQENKILMLSRQSDKPNIDFKLIEKEIRKKNEKYKIMILCKKIPKGIFKKTGYCFYLIKCMYHLATTRICIVNGYVIPVSLLSHKKKLKVIQIWHAMGAIKQFGLQVTNKKEGNRSNIAKIMKMHQNYTNITCTSEATKKIYANAFHIEESKILTLGMPRVDYLLGKDKEIDKQVEKIYAQYPKMKTKEVVLYVPTFRKGKEINLEPIMNAFQGDKYHLIIRLHPLDETKVAEQFLIDKKYQTIDLLKVADYVLTDYSATAFEAAVLRKKIFFYLYDIQEYQEERGLNIPLKQEVPSATFHHIEEIKNAIENKTYCEKEWENFRKKYIETDDIENTKRIVDYILQ